MFWVCHWKRPKRFQLGKALPGGNVIADTFSANFWEASMRTAESQIGVANLSACGTWKVSWKLKIVDLKELGNTLKFEKSTLF